MGWLAPLAVGVAAGFVLGLLFFGGLWFTSIRLVGSAHAARLIAVSFLVRVVVLMAALVVMARIDRMLLIGALPGLIVARVALTQAAAREGGRAPDG